MKVRMTLMKRVIAFRPVETTVYVRLPVCQKLRCNHPSVSRDEQRELFLFGYVNCFRTDFTELAQEWFIVLSECLIVLTRKVYSTGKLAQELYSTIGKNYIVL